MLNTFALIICFITLSVGGALSPFITLILLATGQYILFAVFAAAVAGSAYVVFAT